MAVSSFLRKFFVVIVFVIVVPGMTCFSNNSNCTESVARSPPGACPTGFVPSYTIKDRCDCGFDFNISVQCYSTSNSSSLSFTFCMTYNETSKLTFVGLCPYNANYEPSPTPLPKDVLQLNDQMCGPLNRTGLLCSQCQEGLGLAAFSPYRECLECMDEPYGWILYFFMATFPQTILCLLVIIFRINVASAPLNGFVLAAQITTIGINTIPGPGLAENGFLDQYVVTCYGFWNLDFFKYVLPSFCIKEGISTLTVIALEYTVALYPIFFTVVVYYCITLHDNGCRILVFCWRPFSWCFARFRKTWEPKGSVINAFVTFLLLSYSKLFSISISLLQSVNVLNICGGSDYKVYYDASYERLSKEHLPYVVLASIIIIIFVCLPALFILFYQNKVFQKCLNFLKFKCVLIHELANICQGCFKNGTSPGTRDYRWFAGLYLLLRILFIAMLNQKHFAYVTIVVSCVMSTLVALLRPYRVDFYNKLDTLMLWLNFAIIASYAVNLIAFDDLPSNGGRILNCIPFIYIHCYVAWRLIAFIVKKCRSRIAKRKKSSTTGTEENNELPDRLLQPSEYTPLISTSKRVTLTSDTQETVQSNDTY